MRITLLSLIAIFSATLLLSSCNTNGDEPELIEDTNNNLSMTNGPIGQENYIYRTPSIPASAARGK